MATFQARARTVDLLGRQQIAGIPTAISELFKNAHDAYAQRVEVDYFRDRGLLTLRDDGLGMTPDDFRDRWLTIGTESKAGSQRGVMAPPTLVGQERPILGEKGIGRLAIASIGPQTLVLTRALRGTELSPLTVALINWRLFEVAGINLAEVDVPLTTLDDGRLPDFNDLKALADQLRRTVDRLRLDPKERTPILADLERLKFDPGALLHFLGPPGLGGEGHGTHFFIVPTSEQLPADIDEQPDTREAPPLIQTLIGFANTMLPSSPEPRIATAFRDRKPGEDPVDLIAPAEFFTPDDFRVADHRVDGHFDEYGDFTGTVSVYGGDAQPHDFVWTKGGRRPLDCGPFDFDLAYVQGSASDSRLSPIDHATVTNKLDRIGGLYIYRDGVRILPYGTPGYDFLGIERRRTQNISRAFFSYRRMFGVVDLTRQENRGLEEKAGREGFVQNRAYRQFRDVLTAFFVQLAAEFFSDDRKPQSVAFFRGREEARKRYRLRTQNEERTRKARERFARRVGEITQWLGDGRPQREASEIHVRLLSELDAIAPTSQAREDVLAADRSAQQAVQEVRDRYRLVEPPGVGLPPRLRRDWDYLSGQLEALDGALWEPALRDITRAVAAAEERLPQAPTRRERLLITVDTAAATARRRAAAGASEARDALTDAERRVAVAVQQSDSELDVVEQQARAEAAATKPAIGDDEFADARIELEQLLSAAAERQETALHLLAERLRHAATANGTPDGAATAALAAALEEEVLALRERADRDLELTQLGMTTEVIAHELDQTIVTIRGALDRLRAYADVNERLGVIHDDLRTGFDHLDTYMALFTPLQRRLRRRRAQISGAQVEEFLRGLFARRLEDEDIELCVTDRFRHWRESTFRSTLYPVLVNLVDNASHWVTQARPPRWIELDTDGQALVVRDSGPGVPGRDEDAIWEFGFTRKTGGRGAGLHIAREALARDGWSIDLVRGASAGASFRIDPPQAEKDT